MLHAVTSSAIIWFSECECFIVSGHWAYIFVGSSVWCRLDRDSFKIHRHYHSVLFFEFDEIVDVIEMWKQDWWHRKYGVVVGHFYFSLSEISSKVWCSHCIKWETTSSEGSWSRQTTRQQRPKWRRSILCSKTTPLGLVTEHFVLECMLNNCVVDLDSIRWMKIVECGRSSGLLLFWRHPGFQFSHLAFLFVDWVTAANFHGQKCVGVFSIYAKLFQKRPVPWSSFWASTVLCSPVWHRTVK